MPKIGYKRSIKIPDGICDDLWRHTIYIGFSGNRISINENDSFNNEVFKYFGKTYIDARGFLSLPVEALSILHCEFNDLVVVYKSSDGIFIEKAGMDGAEI